MGLPRCGHRHIADPAVRIVQQLFAPPKREAERLLLAIPPSKDAPKFYVAFVARMLGVAATVGITVFQWYMAQFGLDKASVDSRFLGFHGAGAVVVAMAVCTFVGALAAALLLGRIARAVDDLRMPAVASCVLFAVAAVLPLLIDDHMLAIALYALLAGFCVRRV